jgi:hypothetical protein
VHVAHLHAQEAQLIPQPLILLAQALVLVLQAPAAPLSHVCHGLLFFLQLHQLLDLHLQALHVLLLALAAAARALAVGEHPARGFIAGGLQERLSGKEQRLRCMCNIQDG